jgi:hypothetical protein
MTSGGNSLFPVGGGGKASNFRQHLPPHPTLCMTAPNHESFATPLSLRSTTINKTVIAYTNMRDTTANNFIKSIFVKIDWSICKDMGSFIS